MEYFKTGFEGLYYVKSNVFEDSRGGFIKTYMQSEFKRHGLSTNFKEICYSISKKNVIRGMHFQIPPCAHHKYVHVIMGRALDVVIDLRKASGTYGKFFSMELSEENKISLYIPIGFAHGFKSLEHNTVFLYNASTEHDPACDKGIRYNSFGFDWGDGECFLSERDLCCTETLESFISPF